MSRARATHSKLGYPEALFSFETQTFSSLVSAPTCEHRAENKSVSEKAAPWITRAEATRNTSTVFLPSLLRRKCWKISSSGPLHPKATLDSFDLQTALSSAICGFLCTLTPPAWIHPKKYSSPKTHILLFTFTYPPACWAVHCSIMWSVCFPGRFSSSEGSLKWRLLNKWGCYSPPTLSPLSVFWELAFTKSQELVFGLQKSRGIPLLTWIDVEAFKVII